MSDQYLAEAEAELAADGFVAPQDDAPTKLEAPAVDESLLPIVDKSSEPEAEEPDTTVEDEARAMGWVPKDQYKGDPARWKPADQFVNDGKTVLPLLQSNLKKMTDKVTRMEREHQSNLEGMRRANQIAMARERERIIAHYEQQKVQAVELGDTEGYHAATQAQIRDVRAFDDQVQKQQQPQLPEGVTPELVEGIQGFAQENPWFQVDDEMTKVAIRYSQGLSVKNPNLSLQDNLAKTQKYMRGRYPEAYGDVDDDDRQEQPAAKLMHSPVESSTGRGAGGGKRGKTAANLPAEARREGEQFVKEGLFKDLNAYAKAFFDGE